MGAGLVCALLFVTDWPLRIEVGAIRLYQRFGAPVTGLYATCRFRETCSHYALRQLEEAGFWKGNARIGVRLALCSPLGAALDYVTLGQVLAPESPETPPPTNAGERGEDR